MRTLLRFLACLPLLGLGFSAKAQADYRPPNLVFIMADDLGIYEIGYYGQKHIRTPAIDSLAKNGMVFTQFYAGSPVCAPARCTLMTGKHTGHTSIRSNKESQPEGQQPVAEGTVMFPSLLKDKGYTCGGMGKWGLGMFDTPGSPMKHGFDLFFGYNCQRHAHSHYPTYIYRNDKRIELPGNDGKTGDTFTNDLFEKRSPRIRDPEQGQAVFLVPAVHHSPRRLASARRRAVGGIPKVDRRRPALRRRPRLLATPHATGRLRRHGDTDGPDHRASR